MAEGGYDPTDATTEETPSSQTQGMTTLTYGLTPPNIKSQKMVRVKSKGYQPLVTPTARNPLN